MTTPTPAPVRTYDEQLLTVLDVTNREFARTWVRSLLRDRPEIEAGGVPRSLREATPLPREAVWGEFSHTDQQLNVALELDAVLDTGVIPLAKYYRPHITAARLYLGNPRMWRTRAVDGASESRRDSLEIVGAWLAQGVGLDRMIPAHLHPLPPFDEDGQAVAGAPAADDPYDVAIPLVVSGL